MISLMRRQLCANKEKTDFFGEGLHQGDHLHPNAKGGKMLADAFDLEKLTGR